MKSLICLFAVLLLVALISSATTLVDARVTSWTDAFDHLVNAFKDSPYHRGALIRFMFRVSPRDIVYADRLCDSLDFVRCLGFEGASKGSSSAPAWPMQITVRNRHFLFAYATDALSGDTHIVSQEQRSIEQQETAPDIIDKTSIQQVHYDRLPDNAHVVRLECGNHNDLRVGEDAAFVPESAEEEDELFEMALEDGGGNSNNNNVDGATKDSLRKREKVLRNFVLDVTGEVLKSAAASIRELEVDGCSVRSSNTGAAVGVEFRGVEPTLEALSVTHSLLESSFIDSGTVFENALKRLAIARSSVPSSDLPVFLKPLKTLEELSIRAVDMRVIGRERQHRVPLQLAPVLHAVAKSPSGAGLRTLDLEAFVGLHHHLIGEEDENVKNKKKKQDDDDKEVVKDSHALSASQQQEIFQSVKSLAKLEHLRLANFPLTQAPFEISPACRSLHVVGAKLTEFPDFASQNQQYPLSLEEVDFSANEITSFVPDDSTIPRHIRRVRIAHNKIAGSLAVERIPRHLQELNISHNRLSGPVDFTKIGDKMATLDVSFNAFSGPVNLRELPESLRVLDLSNNKFTGRYDVTKLPLLSTMISFGENDWDSLMPPRKKSLKTKKKKKSSDL